MKRYSFDKLPETGDVKVDGDIRTEYPSSLARFIKDALLDNLFVCPVANSIMIAALVLGVLLLVFGQDTARFIKVVVIVGAVKGYYVFHLIKFYRSFRKREVFPVVTPEGINHMFTLYPNGKRYVRMTTMKWQDVEKLRVYKGFMTLAVKNMNSVEDDIALAYIWSDDIQTLKDQVLYYWKEALKPRGSVSPEVLQYSEKEYEELIDFMSDRFGTYESAVHQFASDNLHVDIAIIPPEDDRNYYTLCTVGAGAYRMNIEKDIRIRHLLSEHSEYMMYLPSDWKFDDESLKSESWNWPVRLLSMIARFPMENDTWFAFGHTIDQEETFCDELPYEGSLIVCPVPGVSGRITGTNLSTGKTVVFYQVLPVTREEIDYKDEHGSSELIGHIFGDDNVLETIINRLKIQ